MPSTPIHVTQPLPLHFPHPVHPLCAPPFTLQVHAAVLRNSNKTVVLKVLKPGVEDVLTTDLSFVYLFSRYLEFIQPDLARL